MRELATDESSHWGTGITAAWHQVPKNVRVVGIAGILIVAGFLGSLYFMAPDEGGDAPEMATSAVAASSVGGRLLFGVDDVALGHTSNEKGQERTRWSGLLRTEGRADLVPGSMSSIASGPVDVDPISDARFTFRSAAYVKDGILHELIIPQDTLRLRIPGEPGHPGDTLFVTFDVGRSVSDEAGRLIFRPFVSEARWIQAPTPSMDDPIGAGDHGDRSTPGVVPESQVYESPTGTQPTPTGKNGGEGTDPPAQVGRATFFVRDEVALAVDSLDMDFAKLGLGQVDDGTEKIATYYEGSKRIDVRQYDGPEDRALLVTFQVPAGDYKDVYLEFATSEAMIAKSTSTLAVPQPTLVLERNFTIEADQTLEFLVDFSVQESISPAGEGWELRPVVAQFQVSDTDTDDDGIPDPRDPDDDDDGTPDNEDPDRDGDGVLDKRPSQYRKGGNVMPSVGQTNSYYVQSTTGRDPDSTTNNAGGALTGGESRPIGSEGEDPQRIVDNAEDLLEDPGVVVQTSNGQQLYILQALSRNLLPSSETLAPLGAVEIKRLDNLPVILVAGPPGIAPDLRALPGVTHVEEDVATAPFP